VTRRSGRETVLDLFGQAFNRSDLAALKALLAPDATAEVLGSGFPVEEGRDTIARTSLPHLLDPDAALTASSLAAGEGEDWILLRTQEGRGPIDAAIRAVVVGDRVERLEYVVAPHRPVELRRIGAACGLPTVADE